MESGAEDTLLLNVALLPPPDVVASVADLSERARALGGSFRVDNVVRFAHLTLYMARFEHLEAKLAHAALLTAAQTLDRHVVEHTGYFITHGNYYEVSYARTPALRGMHSVVTCALSPFRFSPGNPVTERYFGRYSHDQVLNAKECGYDLAGNIYRPHVTITHFREDHGSHGLPTADGSLSFVAKRIGLFEADEMGAARRLIDTIPIS